MKFDVVSVVGGRAMKALCQYNELADKQKPKAIKPKFVVEKTVSNIQRKHIIINYCCVLIESKKIYFNNKKYRW